MFKENVNRKKFEINNVLIIIAVICSIFAVGMILLPFINKASFNIQIKGSNDMQVNYTTTESNTWDVSENGDGSVTATLSADGILTISGIGNMKDWSSSSNVPWYNVRKQVKSVKIEEGVTSIGKAAFSGCNSLTEITIPEGLTSIANAAFYECSSLTEITIPKGVTSIGSDAFSGCSSLTEITIPEGVTRIRPSAFNRCSSLAQIKVDINNTKYCDENGVLYSKDKTEIIKYPEGKKDETYTIIKEVRRIGDYVFSKCSSLIEITIPEGVTYIGDAAFEECSSLTEIKIPEGVTSIGRAAFSKCGSLTEITIPRSVTSIGINAFFKCEIIVFSNSNIVELPDILKRAQDETDILYSSKDFTLQNCTIEDGKIKINDGVSYASIDIEYGKLDGLKYTISYNRWDISENADRSIMAVLDENGCVTISGIGNMKEWKINENAPWYGVRERIKSVKIDEGVTNISDFAFNGCSSVTEITIPNSVTDIGYAAFSGCSSLIEIVIPEGVGSIGDRAFSGCSSLTKIIIPEGVTNIEYGLFSRCSSLIEITIPNNVTSIEGEAFNGCSSLIKIIIPKGVTSIGSSAFYECTNITIICKSNTTAETYAQDNGIKYIVDDDVPTIEFSLNGTNEKVISANTQVIVEDTVAGVDESSLKYYWGTESEGVTEEQIITSFTKDETIETPKESGNYYLWVLAKDLVENVKTSRSKAFKIDAIPPVISVSYTTIAPTNQDITVTITANEELQDVEGWVLSEDELTLTKEYAENKTEDIIIKDVVGNETTVNVKITNIDKVAPTAEVSYSTIEPTNENVKITITTNEEIQEVEGWILSEDKLTLTKEYEDNTESSGENIKIKDLAGNEITLNIKITNIRIFKENTYEIKGIYIAKINPNTLYRDFIKNIYTKMKYVLKEGNDDVLETSKMKTGQILTVGNRSYTIVVRGDINGDGKIGISELARASRLGISQEGATELEMIAVDVNMDGDIKVNDLAAISRLARE